MAIDNCYLGLLSGESYVKIVPSAIGSLVAYVVVWCGFEPRMDEHQPSPRAMVLSSSSRSGQSLRWTTFARGDPLRIPQYSVDPWMVDAVQQDVWERSEWVEMASQQQRRTSVLRFPMCRGARAATKLRQLVSTTWVDTAWVQRSFHKRNTGSLRRRVFTMLADTLRAHNSGVVVSTIHGAAK